MASPGRHLTNFILHFLKLQSRHSETLKDISDSSLAFSLSNMTVLSCVCYTGPYEVLLECPKCKHNHYKANGKTPHSYSKYLPLIPCLHAMVLNPSYVWKMQYQSNHQWDPTKLTDIFDGTQYGLLLEEFVTISDEELLMHFFSDPCDIALGLSSDSFCPFKHCTKTSWPLILFNYNLSPDKQFHKRNTISLGNIPGPKKPCNMDSFLWPLVQELLQLEIGISAFDVISNVMFLLHAYLIIVF